LKDMITGRKTRSRNSIFRSLECQAPVSCC